MTTNPASLRSPGDSLASGPRPTSGAFPAGETRTSGAGRTASRSPDERFDATMSRALRQANRDAAGTKEPARPEVREDTAPTGSRSAADARERNDADATADAQDATSASADGASNAIAPAAVALSSPIVPSTPPAEGDAGPDAVGGATGSPRLTAQDGASPLARPGAATAEKPQAAPLATAAKTARSNASAATDGPEASSAGTDEAGTTTTDGDLPPDAAGDSASAASLPDAASRRATPDFATQLAHARLASASDAARFEPTRTTSAPPMQTHAAHAAAVATPMHAAGFPAHFAAEVAMLGASGIERAEIQLQPPELGPVRIELSLNGESARLAFSATQPETRQAIEQSLPILKELLAERGLTLGDTSVSSGTAHADGGADQHGQTAGGANAAHGDAVSGADLRGASDAARRTALRLGLLDVYA